MTATSKEEARRISLFTDVQLCREFGWTPTDIAELPGDFYEAAILILSKENARRKRETEKSDRTGKRGR